MADSKVASLTINSMAQLEALSQQVSAVNEDNSNLVSLLEAKTSSLQVKEQQIDVLKRELAVREQEVDSKNKELNAKQQQIDSVTEKDQARIDALQEQLSVREQELKTRKQELAAKQQELMAKQHELEAQQEELTAKEKLYQDQLSAKDKFHEDQQSAKTQEISALQNQLQRQTEATSQERAALQEEIAYIRKGLQIKNAEIEVQRERVRTTEEEVRLKAAEITSKDALLQSKEKMVQNKDRTIQSLRDEVESLKQRGPKQVTFLHSVGASLEWKQCAGLPVKMDNAQAVQLKSKVYVQGSTPSSETDSTIYTYEVPTDAWVSIKSPVYYSALAVYDSQLVLVGGMECTTDKVTNKLWVLQDEQTWTQSLPAMPTARHSATAVSHGDHLAVAGGDTGWDTHSDSVEVYYDQQWMRAAPFPVACRDMKATYHSGIWYLMGRDGQVLYTSLDALIEIAIGKHRYSRSPDGNKKESVWKMLPDVPYQFSSATTLGGALLAVGGVDSNETKTSVHAYSPLTRSWVHVGDTPKAVSFTCTVNLTTGQTMVIGGQTENAKSCRVHKLSLKLQ